MDCNNNILCWNVRGLNDKSRRDALRGLIHDYNVSAVCIQETKLSSINDQLIYGMLGSSFRSYHYLPAVRTRGGILIACRSPDASTNFFHLQASYRKKKKLITRLQSPNGPALSQEEIAEELFRILTLIPKQDNAERAADFRPICLIHSFATIFAKMLARRLTPVIGSLIDANQSAFIKDRSIHDNFKLVQATAKLFKNKKKPKLLLKLDIAKAFDTVAWPFLLQILEHSGFGPRWRQWITILLATASTRILLNGDPGKPIKLARGPPLADAVCAGNERLQQTGEPRRYARPTRINRTQGLTAPLLAVCRRRGIIHHPIRAGPSNDLHDPQRLRRSIRPPH